MGSMLVEVVAPNKLYKLSYFFIMTDILFVNSKFARIFSQNSTDFSHSCQFRGEPGHHLPPPPPPVHLREVYVEKCAQTPIGI